ncbi:MAG TPA: ACP S-malonyltransferase [Candidatus Dormibacteraeota bacterium]|nr:ACP S-malonyltransferase [Candidatus Dormibacteraeota bacterium]
MREATGVGTSPSRPAGGGVAFLFPGQGSQHQGMGAELLDDAEIAELARRCSRAAGIDLVWLLTSAGEEELRATANAQPALLFMGVALARLLERAGIRPDAAAGHSVGEYTALCVAGAIAPEEAVQVVVARGRAMAAAAPPGTSSMCAVLGIGPEVVERALEGVPEVWLANYNTPTQTVIGGSLRGLELAAERVRKAGARRVVPLNVAAAFHTPIVAPAGAGLRGTLRAVAWRAPRLPVVANLTGEPYRTAEEIPDVLERQLSAPVRWADCVRQLAAMGCRHFVEVGPRRVLAGMMRELVPTARAHAVSTRAAALQLCLA